MPQKLAARTTSFWRELPSLPLTANGKLDRRALPAPDTAPRGAAVAPRNATEEAIAAVWREVLGLPAVGVKGSFFDLGGHSLLVVQVHRRLAAAGTRIDRARQQRELRRQVRNR